MNDFIIIFASILISFCLGASLMLFVGGKTTLNYLLTKWGKGSKIFMWVDTPLGRISKVGKIEGQINEGVVSWKYRGETKLTELTKDTVGDFMKVKYIAVNVGSPEKAYNLTILGELPARTIDQPTFNNILKRALTRPALDDDFLKKIMIVMVMVGIVGLAVLFAVFKIINIETLVKALGVI